MRWQVREDRLRIQQREEALARFDATADSLKREMFKHQSTKRMLASVSMDLCTSVAVGALSSLTRAATPVVQSPSLSPSFVCSLRDASRVGGIS